MSLRAPQDATVQWKPCLVSPYWWQEPSRRRAAAASPGNGSPGDARCLLPSQGWQSLCKYTAAAVEPGTASPGSMQTGAVPLRDREQPGKAGPEQWARFLGAILGDQGKPGGCRGAAGSQGSASARCWDAAVALRCLPTPVGFFITESSSLEKTSKIIKSNRGEGLRSLCTALPS